MNGLLICATGPAEIDAVCGEWQGDRLRHTAGLLSDEVRSRIEATFELACLRSRLGDVFTGECGRESTAADRELVECSPIRGGKIQYDALKM